jgi:hypothetical protein
MTEKAVFRAAKGFLALPSKFNVKVPFRSYILVQVPQPGGHNRAWKTVWRGASLNEYGAQAPQRVAMTLQALSKCGNFEVKSLPRLRGCTSLLSLNRKVGPKISRFHRTSRIRKEWDCSKLDQINSVP